MKTDDPRVAYEHLQQQIDRLEALSVDNTTTIHALFIAMTLPESARVSYLETVLERGLAMRKDEGRSGEVFGAALQWMQGEPPSEPYSTPGYIRLVPDPSGREE